MQQQIPMLAEVHKPRFATTTELVLASRSLSSSIALAIRLSGFTDETVCETLGIDKGHFSRIMKGRAHFPVNKLPALMELTQSLAPLQWLANRMGFNLVQQQHSEEIEALRARLRVLENAA